MIPMCDEQDGCTCFNESSNAKLLCGCLPGYKVEMKGGKSVCSGMNYANCNVYYNIIDHTQTIMHTCSGGIACFQLQSDRILHDTHIF